jgi:hypothetical protein
MNSLEKRELGALRQAFENPRKTAITKRVFAYATSI